MTSSCRISLSVCWDCPWCLWSVESVIRRSRGRIQTERRRNIIPWPCVYRYVSKLWQSMRPSEKNSRAFAVSLISWELVTLELYNQDRRFICVLLMEFISLKNPKYNRIRILSSVILTGATVALALFWRNDFVFFLRVMCVAGMYPTPNTPWWH